MRGRGSEFIKQNRVGVEFRPTALPRSRFSRRQMVQRGSKVRFNAAGAAEIYVEKIRVGDWCFS